MKGDLFVTSRLSALEIARAGESEQISFGRIREDFLPGCFVYFSYIFIFMPVDRNEVRFANTYFSRHQTKKLQQRRTADSLADKDAEVKRRKGTKLDCFLK